MPRTPNQILLYSSTSNFITVAVVGVRVPMTQMLSAVQDQVESGDLDELGDILGDINGRPQELYWKEDAEGVLFVSPDERRPETIARIALEDGELTATEPDPAEVDWDSLPTLSEPDSAIRDRQFD